jgi:hypothetical protein
LGDGSEVVHVIVDGAGLTAIIVFYGILTYEDENKTNHDEREQRSDKYPIFEDTDNVLLDIGNDRNDDNRCCKTEDTLPDKIVTIFIFFP